MANGETKDLTLLGGQSRYDEEEGDRELELRLRTFDHRWKGKIDKTHLAKAGFTYTGIGDKVECEQCGLKLLNWTSTDDPLHEHATRRPLCPFINSRYRQLGQTKPPKHPKYQQLQDRLDSFTCWPTQYIPKTPDQLAAAGFFYIGSADRVTCFQCGITLRDWEEEHDPFTEHQRYSENCQFINKTDPNQLGVAIRHQNTDEASGCGIQVETVNDLEIEDKGGASVLPTTNRKSSTKPNLLNCKATEDDDFAIYGSSLHVTTTVSTNTSKSSRTKETGDEMGISNGRNPTSMLSSLRLAEENSRLRQKGTCRVCGENKVAILFLPCGHLITCSDCAPKVSECLICKKTILGTVKTFFT